MIRLYDDNEMCIWWRSRKGCDAKKLSCLRQLNPGLSQEKIVGILQAGGIEVKVRKSAPKPGGRPKLTLDRKIELRQEYSAWLEKKKRNREPIKDICARWHISYLTLQKVVNAREEDLCESDQ